MAVHLINGRIEIKGRQQRTLARPAYTDDKYLPVLPAQDVFREIKDILSFRIVAKILSHHWGHCFIKTFLIESFIKYVNNAAVSE